MTRAPDNGSEKLAIERRKIGIAAMISLPVCAGILAAAYFILPLYFTFPIELVDRLAFTLQADLFIVLWVMIASGIVSRSRRHSAQDIDAAIGGPPSRKLAIEIAFLQNTLEQAFIAVGTHLALATLIEGPALSLIVGAVALFAIGRITFLAGYHKGAGGRAFGMVTTVLPALAGMAWALAMITLP